MNCYRLNVQTVSAPNNSPCNFVKSEGNAPNMLNVLLYCLCLEGRPPVLQPQCKIHIFPASEVMTLNPQDNELT